jgi:hypothetical protein
MEKFYLIDGEQESYKTLADIKNHICMMCESDKKDYNGASIAKVVYGETDCAWGRTIEVKNGVVSFAKMQKK